MPALPEKPDIRHVKLQARTLLNSALQGDDSALSRIDAVLGKATKPPVLADAYHVLSREYGFDSWPRLKASVEASKMTDSEKLDAFLTAAWIWGDRTRAKAVLDASPEISQANILTACASGDVSAARVILEAKPDDASAVGGPRDWSPILYATWSCFVGDKPDEMAAIVSLLLQHGADPNSYWTNESGFKETALYGGVEQNCVSVVRILVEADADPNDEESLYHACEKFNLELLDLLAVNGLDPTSVS